MHLQEIRIHIYEHHLRKTKIPADAYKLLYNIEIGKHDQRILLQT